MAIKTSQRNLTNVWFHDLKSKYRLNGWPKVLKRKSTIGVRSSSNILIVQPLSLLMNSSKRKSSGIFSHHDRATRMSFVEWFHQRKCSTFKHSAATFHRRRHSANCGKKSRNYHKTAVLNIWHFLLQYCINEYIKRSMVKRNKRRRAKFKSLNWQQTYGRHKYQKRTFQVDIATWWHFLATVVS